MLSFALRAIGLAELPHAASPTRSVLRFASRLLSFGFIALLVSSCAFYRPLAVKTSASNYPMIVSPLVNESPVVQTADFNVYEMAGAQGKYFVVPTSLAPIEAERGSLLAIALERYDGSHLIFVSALGPRADLLASARAHLSALSLRVDSLDFYPIDQLSIRPLTDPRVPAEVNFTAVAAPGLTLTPFHLLVAVQVNSSGAVLAMKGLLNTNAGILLEGTYTLRVRNGTGDLIRPQTVVAVIRNAEVTSLSK